jgi:hypothetical protein
MYSTAKYLHFSTGIARRVENSDRISHYMGDNSLQIPCCFSVVYIWSCYLQAGARPAAEHRRFVIVTSDNAGF